MCSSVDKLMMSMNPRMFAICSVLYFTVPNVDKLMRSMNELHKFMAIDAPMRDSESRMRSGFPGNQHTLAESS